MDFPGLPSEYRRRQRAETDPLKRFEYLRNGKATSVMIRATPNAVRWDQINRVQYRFQALNFHSDVLEALIHNSPPLSRREQNAATSKPGYQRDLLRGGDLDNNNNDDLSSDDDEENDTNNNNNNVIDKKNARAASISRQVKAIRRTNSCDANHELERKGSVVQVSPKDDTSDYNSDEDVFHGRSSACGSFENVSYNTTICHVKTGQIKDTAQIHVTSSCANTTAGTDEDRKEVNRNNIHLLADPATYDKEDSRKTSSAPPSTKVSTATTPAEHHGSMGERFRSEIDRLDYLHQEDLTSKSKEELVELVKNLQKELETTKHQSYQRQHSPPHSPLHSPLHSRVGTTTRCYSRQDSIDEENEEVENSDALLPKVSSLVESFEQKTSNEEEGELRRSNTLPYRLRKPQT